MNIQVVTQADQNLLEKINQLLPQLSEKAQPLTNGALLKIIGSGESNLIVAKEGEEIFGMLTLAIYTTPTGVKAWIEDVVVEEKSRGRGIGRKLTEFAIGHAKELGAKSISMTSRPSRVAANQLYQKLGFELRKTNVYCISL